MNVREYSTVRLFLMIFLCFALIVPIVLPTSNVQYPVSNAQSNSASSSSREVIVIRLNVAIDPGSSGLVARAISQAQSDKAAAIIIDMNTPGGLLSDMVSIVNSITNSSVPVYTYVGNGSLAASAGSYIAMASVKIFMGPGSEIGPSTPIVEGGSSLQQNHTASAMLNFMEALAAQHGRNQTAVFNMVVYDIAYSNIEALSYHVADMGSNSLSETLLDLNLSGANIVTISENPPEQLLSFLADPVVDGILLLLGIVAIVLDFLHPTILLSVAGVVIIVLALIGAEAIQGAGTPGYSFAVPLVLFAVAATLIVFELKTGHGFFLFTGIAVGALGTYLIAYQVPYSPSPFGDLQYIEIAILLVAGGLLALYARWISKSLRKKPVTGAEALTGRSGIAYSDLDPEGEVSIDGVIWKAKLASGVTKIAKGQQIVVRGISGLTLVVQPESIKEKE